MNHPAPGPVPEGCFLTSYEREPYEFETWAHFPEAPDCKVCSQPLRMNLSRAPGEPSTATGVMFTLDIRDPESWHLIELTKHITCVCCADECEDDLKAELKRVPAYLKEAS